MQEREREGEEGEEGDKQMIYISIHQYTAATKDYILDKLSVQ
jgi:hypothetical protein